MGRRTDCRAEPGCQLPHQTIVPIRREDASGDTFIFTQFLDFSTQSWEDRIRLWHQHRLAGVWLARKPPTGNEGMVETLAATPYSIGYVGISFRDAIAKAGLGTAPLRNQNGKFVLPTAETISAAASELDPRTPADERLSLVFAPGDDSYPLINYEYAVVSTKQPDPATADGTAPLPALGGLDRRRQRAEIPRRRRLHSAARLHPRAEREPDQPDQVMPGRLLPWAANADGRSHGRRRGTRSEDAGPHLRGDDVGIRVSVQHRHVSDILM